MAPPDITLLYRSEAREWDAYLSRQFESFENQESIVIAHEQLEDISFPIPASRIRNFSDARVVLIIISPSFLDFLDHHAEEGFQIGKLLKPRRTVAMLCGVQPSDVSSFHKAALVSYNDWPQIVALDKDLDMVRNVVDTVHDILIRSKENERIHKPKFKLVPRKVNEGNGKVFVILEKPIDDTRKMKITLEGNGVKEVSVKRRNPYTFQFVVPDSCLQVLSVLNVHVRCNDDFLGVTQLKCESRMGELYNLLSVVNSPYEFLCRTLGMASLHEVDEQLTESFRKNLPGSGFSLLKMEDKCEKMKSKEEFPTLLHFAARYGLGNLVKELLQCPGAQIACFLRNTRGLIPAQMANHAGHNDIANTLENFQKSLGTCERMRTNEDQVSQPIIITSEKKHRKYSDRTDYYDIPPPNPVPVHVQPVISSEDESITCEKEGEYLKMMGSSLPHLENVENLEPHKHLILGIDKKDEKEEAMISSLSTCSPSATGEVPSSERMKVTLLESQAKLIEIMEVYKKGASLTDVEKLHNEWKATHKISDLEAKSTLEELKSLYAKAQKAKMSKKQSSSFSELRHFIGSKLRRKDSVGSKASSSRKNSRELTSIEKLCMEADGLRPVSTLSSMSTTSSSSGSSFDRLSSVSGSSDSGNHSDFCEEVSRIKEAIRFDSKLQDLMSTNGNLQRNHLLLSLSDKPPAAPPRPVKPPLRVTTYENKMYAHKGSDSDYLIPPQRPIPTSCGNVRPVDYVLPDSFASSGKSSDPGSSRKTSVSKSTDNLFSALGCSSDSQDPSKLYDCPPPASQNNELKKTGNNARNGAHRVSSDGADNIVGNCFPNDTARANVVSPSLDYDMVPPPLPLSCPPRRTSTSSHSDEISQCYDIPKSFPQFNISQDLLGMKCNCPKAELSCPPKTKNEICMCDSSASHQKHMTLLHCCPSDGSMYDFPASLRKNSLPSVPCSEFVAKSKPAPASSTNNCRNLEALKLQYYNMCFAQNGESKDSRDSIPDMPPPPPPVEQDDDDDHYKLVGIPVPVPEFSLINLPLKCSETFNTSEIQKSNGQIKHLLMKNV